MGVKPGATLKTSNTFMRFPMIKMYIRNGKKWEFRLVAPPDLQYCTKTEAKEEERRLSRAGNIVHLYKRSWISPKDGRHREAWVCYALNIMKPKLWEH